MPALLTSYLCTRARRRGASSAIAARETSSYGLSRSSAAAVWDELCGAGGVRAGVGACRYGTALMLSGATAPFGDMTSGVDWNSFPQPLPGSTTPSGGRSTLGATGAPSAPERHAPDRARRPARSGPPGARLDYAVELAPTDCRFAPFASSTHGYDTTDHLRIDLAWG